MYLGYVSVYCLIILVVFGRRISGMNKTASPGKSITLECSSNQSLTYINWYKTNVRMVSVERYSSGNCSVFNSVKYLKFTVGRCDEYVQHLIINNVSYTNKNGAHWSCNGTTTNNFILSVVGSENTKTATSPGTTRETTSATSTTDITDSTATATTIVNTDSTTATDNTDSTTATSNTDSTTATANTDSTTATANTYTTIQHTTTEQKKTKEGESETNLIIAGSVASAILIIVLALVVIIVVNKRRKKSTATNEPIMLENDLYVSADPGVDGAGNATRNQSVCQADIPEYAKVSETNKSYQPSTEPVIMENDLYTSADQPTTEPIIMENDLYTSADQFQADCKDAYIDNEGSAHYNSSREKNNQPVPIHGDNDGPVYSLVDKTKKQVPDNNDGPVYSVVNKNKQPVPIPDDNDEQFIT